MSQPVNLNCAHPSKYRSRRGMMALRFALSFGLPLTLSWVIVAIGARPAMAQRQGVNYIYTIEGDAELRSENQNYFQRAYSGDFLNSSDQLRVRRNSRVGIICNDIRAFVLQAGTHTIGDTCNARRWFIFNPWRRRPPARTFNANVPYILSPRNSSILGNEQPTIQWSPVDGAQQYSVRVTGPDSELVWETEVCGTEITYGGAVLTPDERYRIEVIADNGLSSRADIAVGFTILSEQESALVKDQVEQIKSLEQDADSEAIGLALIYQGYEHSDPDKNGNGLYQVALEVLQERIDGETENSQIYLLQGNIYLVTGLPLEAKERYEQALALATNTDQPARQARSLEGLATIAEGDSRITDAISHLEAAIAIHESLGNSMRAEELQKHIEILRIFI